MSHPQVLLKNVGGALPLNPSQVKQVLLAGDGRSSLQRQCGGWNLGWQGPEGGAQQVGTTVQQALVNIGMQSTTLVATAESQVQRTGPDSVVALVVVGETSYAEFYGDK